MAILSFKLTKLRFCILALLLVLSPIYVPGAILGVLLGYEASTKDPKAVPKWTKDMERLDFMMSVSFPDLPMWESSPRPYYIPKLETWSWFRRLNLTGCDPDTVNCDGRPKDDQGIDKHADFNFWCRDSKIDAPLHHWIYVSKWGDFIMDDWDKAFNQLLQYHYVNPPANNATIDIVSCMDSQFLCHTWEIEPPTMLYLSVDLESKEDMMPDRPSFGAAPAYLPLKVYVKTLPLDTDLPGAIGTFPSRFEQLRQLTTTPNIDEELDEWDEFPMVFARLFRELKGGRFGLVGKVVGEWSEKLLDSKGILYPNVLGAGIAFGFVGSVPSLFCWRLLVGISKEVYNWFVLGPQTQKPWTKKRNIWSRMFGEDLFEEFIANAGKAAENEKLTTELGRTTSFKSYSTSTSTLPDRSGLFDSTSLQRSPSTA
jgi:hypothetical protein